MIAKEADLHALEFVMQYTLTEAVKAQDNNEPKMYKAYMRIWNRLQKVYLRTDNSLNFTGGNA
jgi:hypothetical protein